MSVTQSVSPYFLHIKCMGPGMPIGGCVNPELVVTKCTTKNARKFVSWFAKEKCQFLPIFFGYLLLFSVKIYYILVEFTNLNF